MGWVAAPDGTCAIVVRTRSLNRRVHAAAASVTGSAAPVTVSVGLCCRALRSGRSFDQVVKAADQALYEAKASGRNRSVIAGDGVLRPYG